MVLKSSQGDKVGFTHIKSEALHATGVRRFGSQAGRVENQQACVIGLINPSWEFLSQRQRTPASPVKIHSAMV